MFVAARLLFVARFDVNTAATILDVMGVATVIAGTTLTLLPFAVGLATWACAVLVYVDPSLSPLRPEPTRLVLAFLVVGSLCLLAAQLAVATVLVVAVLLVVSVRRRGRPLVDVRHVVRESRVVRAELRVLAVALTLTPLLLQRPWLPLETVSMRDGSVVVGYVLGDKEGELALLDERTRTVTLTAPATVRTRQICEGLERPPGAVGRLPQLRSTGSLVGRLLYGGAVPEYPPCAASREAGAQQPSP